MNVLVDTNVVISAVIRDRLPQRVMDEILSRDDWFWIVTTEIETEYREVLAQPKFKVPVLALSTLFLASPEADQNPRDQIRFRIQSVAALP